MGIKTFIMLLWLAPHYGNKFLIRFGGLSSVSNASFNKRFGLGLKSKQNDQSELVSLWINDSQLH